MDFAIMVMELLSKDLLFFQKRDITWDGAHHGLECVRVNDAKYDYSRVPLFADLPGGGAYDTYFDELKEYAEKNGFSDVWELATYFQIALLEIEQDDELIVPRSMVSPDLSGGLPEGDLTAISLLNLAGCRGMLEVREGGERYLVGCGERLALGIPRFYDLVARLL